MKSQNDPTMPERRKLLAAGAGIAAASLIPHVSAASQSSQVDSSRQTHQRPAPPCKRKLGQLEVSAIGLGVQNMSRKYDTSAPWRPEMINISTGHLMKESHSSTPLKPTARLKLKKFSVKASPHSGTKSLSPLSLAGTLTNKRVSVCRALTAGRSISDMSSRTCSNACVPIVSTYCINTVLIRRSQSKMSPAR